MTNFWFVVMLAVFAMLGSGCARTDVTHPQDQSLTRSVTTLDDQFMRIAEQIPGFGGLFFDENGVLNVYMKAVEAPPNATALRELQMRVVTAIAEVMGQNFFAQARGPRGGPAKQALPELAKESKILKGKFDVLQLAVWRKSLDQVLSMPGVVFTDLDEQQNRLTVGIEASTERKSIEAQVNALGIPQEAVIIEVTEPTRVQATLRDKRRPVVGGLQIEADTGLLGAFNICTMGFNAQRTGSDGFVVNSHCTETQGVSNDTDFHQPDDPFFSEGQDR
jgi:hypothetical protein